VASRALAWLNYVSEHFGEKPIVYTYPDYSPAVLDHKEFSKYPLWIADPNKVSSPQIPSTWGKHYAVW